MNRVRIPWLAAVAASAARNRARTVWLAVVTASAIALIVAPSAVFAARSSATRQPASAARSAAEGQPGSAIARSYVGLPPALVAQLPSGNVSPPPSRLSSPAPGASSPPAPGASSSPAPGADPIVSDGVGGGGLSRSEPPSGYTWCASEGGTCTFSGTRDVAFGADAYEYQTASGSVACSNSAFGGDPAHRFLKACYVAPAGGPAGFKQCASENGTCTISGPTMVAFGANGSFTMRVLASTVACTNDTFGGDPLHGVVKGCYLAPGGGPAGNWAQCAAKSGTCTVTGPQTVAFGANGSFDYATENGTFSCTTATFGSDPLLGVSKACYTRSGGPVGFGTKCAAKNGTCSFSGFRTVAFGADGSYTYKSFTGGTPCTTAAFGGDPISGVAKSCYLTP